jgi:hypothetical protein
LRMEADTEGAGSDITGKQGLLLPREWLSRNPGLYHTASSKADFNGEALPLKRWWFWRRHVRVRIRSEGPVGSGSGFGIWVRDSVAG